ncbi:MAG: hypothetical protein IPM15_21400 [Betaproteobacteria bacterium]|nr:hypothetical protein [Betaproteobacteria bacterium]
MLRFIPDSWSDGLLRPLLLGDPVVGLYLEAHAPDWRFPLLIVFLVVAAAGMALGKAPRGRLHAPSGLLTAVQWRLLIGLFLTFYLWTFLSGNGRYFMWALMVVGPLVVVAAGRLPATQAMRNTVIVGAIALQGWAVWMTYEPNLWGLRPWRDGPGMTLAKTPLQDKPAVFLTIGFISYSILVPQMHPLSRWANITGQRDIVPGTPEHEKLQALLNSPLPKYVLFNAARIARAKDDQPLAAAGEAMQRILREQSLQPLARHCDFVAATVGGTPFNMRSQQPVEDGFWFCAVEPVRARQVVEPRKPVAPELDDVFERVERHCPRYFPAGSAHTRLASDGAFVRHYAYSDTSLFINEAGGVYFKYFRAINPSVIGEVHTVRQGQLTLDCTRLPGRYVPPWERD